MRNLNVELVKGRILWHVNLVSASNGEIVLTSESYFSKSNAMRAARRLSVILNPPSDPAKKPKRK